MSCQNVALLTAQQYDRPEDSTEREGEEDREDVEESEIN